MSSLKRKWFSESHKLRNFSLILASSGILKQLTPHHVPHGISRDQSSGGERRADQSFGGGGREGIHNFRTQRENNNSLIQNKTHRDCRENRTAD